MGVQVNVTFAQLHLRVPSAGWSTRRRRLRPIEASSAKREIAVLGRIG